jgi:predicted Zn-dependent protease
LPASDARVRQVRGIGEKLAAAATKYLADNRASDRVEGFQWEFNVVNDNTVNAWCMPGGKVVVYTGILPVTQDDAGLAVVMGHEIAHAIARHGNERMSQAIALQGAGMTLEVLTAQKPGMARDIFLQSVGIGGNWACSSLQPQARDRGRQDGPGLHGHGRATIPARHPSSGSA